MDERKVKRLLVTLAVSIAVIMVLKGLMLKVATVHVNKAAERKQAAPAAPAGQPAPSVSAAVSDTADAAAASATLETPGADATAASGAYAAP